MHCNQTTLSRANIAHVQLHDSELQYAAKMTDAEWFTFAYNKSVHRKSGFVAIAAGDMSQCVELLSGSFLMGHRPKSVNLTRRPFIKTVCGPEKYVTSLQLMAENTAFLHITELASNFLCGRQNECTQWARASTSALGTRQERAATNIEFLTVEFVFTCVTTFLAKSCLPRRVEKLRRRPERPKKTSRKVTKRRRGSAGRRVMPSTSTRC